MQPSAERKPELLLIIAVDAYEKEGARYLQRVLSSSKEACIWIQKILLYPRQIIPLNVLREGVRELLAQSWELTRMSYFFWNDQCVRPATSALLMLSLMLTSIPLGTTGWMDRWR
jgi:hypothetical protein